MTLLGGTHKMLMAEMKALGYFFARSENPPQGGSGGNPGAGHSFRQDITRAHLPEPRPSDNRRGAGLFFDSGSNFFVWQFGSGRNSARAESPSRIVVNA